MRFVLQLALVMTLLAPATCAEAQASLSIDLTPGLETLGLVMLGALDLAVIAADDILVATEGRRRALPDMEIALGAMQLLGAIPTWWSWTTQTVPSYREVALAAAAELTAAGALMLVSGVVAYVRSDGNAAWRVALTPTTGGIVATLTGVLDGGRARTRRPPR